MAINPITTHILDTTLGLPAVGVRVTLDRLDDEVEDWRLVTHGDTDEDGRISNWIPADFPLIQSIYRITFETGAYFDGQNRASIFPSVSIDFHVTDTSQHYHLPLLISENGYTTYRGR